MSKQMHFIFIESVIVRLFKVYTECRYTQKCTQPYTTYALVYTHIFTCTPTYNSKPHTVCLRPN